jgi:ParB-like chromosome segregation protein Spo0J
MAEAAAAKATEKAEANGAATNGEAKPEDKTKGLIEATATFKYGTRKFKIPYIKLADPLTKEEEKELFDSIKSLGIIHPIVVTEDDTVLSGHNRLMLAHKAEIPLKDVPITVRKRDNTMEEQVEVSQAANFVGRKHTPERRASAAHMLRKLDFSARKIAKVLGCDHTTIMEDLGKPDPLHPELEHEESEDKTVVGADGKRHPAKKGKKGKKKGAKATQTAAQINQAAADKRKAIVFKKHRKNALSAVSLLIRTLDHIGLGDKHRDKLQKIMDECREAKYEATA